MTDHVPWIEAACLIPLLGAIWVRLLPDPDRARRHTLVACGLTLLCTLGAWELSARAVEDVAHDAASASWFSVDALSAPLLPLVSLLCLLIVLATLGAKARRFSFSAMLVSEAILLATMTCAEPWALIILLAAGTVPPWLDLYQQGRPTRVYTLHMVIFIALLAAGQALIRSDGQASEYSTVGVGLVMVAVLLRSGIAPLHCWMPDLFDKASFGMSILYVTPMVGAYAATRLVFPIAPDWMLRCAALLSIATAIYAAGMALVERDARRFYCYLFLSHSSLIFVGLETASPVGVTAALCAWLSVALSMAGFGLTLRAIETRTGRLSLDKFHGLYSHTPRLAALFLITGLASVGFPGTVGFIGAELLVEGAMEAHPLAGIAIVIAAALNGLAVTHAYFRVFTGTTHPSSIDLGSRPPEVIAVLVLTALILGGGLYPQPGVAGRYNVATQLVEQRELSIAASAARGAESASVPAR